ncbi:MAG: hypothetical protein JKY65_21900 [Planctomycetes bacterium]|nr:hypothetical protein [Planctomycetota bacterium]
MDEELRALETRWLASGDEADQHLWLCHKLRLGWDGGEFQDKVTDLGDAIGAAFKDDPDVKVACRVGFETAQAGPCDRLALFSDHRGWRPTPNLDVALEKVLDVQGLVGLFPHTNFDTSDIGWRFSSLFGKGVFFLSSQLLDSPKGSWEFHGNLAVGATFGPLVGYLSVIAHDSV